MAKYAGGGVRSVVDFLQISAADAARSYADQEFSATDGGDRDSLHAHVVDTVIDDGAHGSRELLHRLEFSA
jgi:hypothetical protein